MRVYSGKAVDIVTEEELALSWKQPRVGYRPAYAGEHRPDVPQQHSENLGSFELNKIIMCLQSAVDGTVSRTGTNAGYAW